MKEELIKLLEEYQEFINVNSTPATPWKFNLEDFLLLVNYKMKLATNEVSQIAIALIQYANACNRIRDEFIIKYFDGNADHYWIADEIGGILSLNDYFFGFDDMKMALEKNVKPKWLFQYYDWSLETKPSDKGERNLNYFLNLKKLKQI